MKGFLSAGLCAFLFTAMAFAGAQYAHTKNPNSRSMQKMETRGAKDKARTKTPDKQMGSSSATSTKGQNSD